MSVGVVLAVAAAGPLVAPAATAATVPTAAVAPAAETATAPIQVPFLASGGEVIGAGNTGFLTRDADQVVRWTRYADGVSTVVGTGTAVLGSASDSVVRAWPRMQRYGTEKAEVYDMATGAAPVTFGSLSGYVTGAVGTALFDDGWQFHPYLSTHVGGVPSTSRVVGMTEGTSSAFALVDSLPGTALGYYRGTYPVTSRKLVVVDIAGARVTETYAVGEGASDSASISQDRVDWTEYVGGKTVLVSAKRGSDEVTRVPLAGAGQGSFKGSLDGGWFVLGEKWVSPTTGGIVARSLTGGTSFKLLDHAESVMKAADGTLLAVGTTADRGTGVYRLAVKDGKPSAELIATTGEPPAPTTPISYTGHAIPAVLNLDGVAKTRMSWKFSTTKADLSIELRHKTGAPFRTTVRPRTTGTGVLPDGSLGIDWAGETGWGSSPMVAALNGAYEWKVTARPWNGMPAATATGTFQVTRTPKAHDYSGNGSPDLFARRTDGDVDVIDTRWDDATGRLVAGEPRRLAYDSEDWNAYDRVEAVGNIAGTTVFDVVARDTAGVLWLHVGSPSSGQRPAKVGGGWNTYDLLAGGSDLTGDGRSDLVGVDKAGDLYLYKGTGSASAPYGVRKKIGVGWGVYNELTAVGNVAGAPAGDLVARDKAGVLWLYLGKGDGTYAPRIRVGGGWNEYTDLVGIGDANKDGRPDLYVRTTGTNTSYFYAGTGDWRAPFATRATTQAGVNNTRATYNRVF
ncbi:VCBS repeat-containing protein [Streptomyces sp. NPDC002773]|uniref:FG-GAP repeat domain-containing protein n=1 Tax=Streptomyces sp. NPDC002773 TaxID=3154430 RepID=UPI00332CEC8B